VFEWFNKNDDRSYQAIDMLDEKVVAQLERREVDCPRCGGGGEIDKIIRTTKEVPCPKDKALLADLERCEETGRIVIFAGFTGSVDRIEKLCRKEGWTTVRLDGRGYEVRKPSKEPQGEVVTNSGDEALALWADLDNTPQVAFIAHPESGGMSLTLTESRMAVFWSNSFKTEYRSQAMDRIHRMGMDMNLGCEIVDYIHLPSDLRVIEVLDDNRRIELMTMGDFPVDEDILVGDDDTLIAEAA
jgi:SNF2 family DNA or RNA helicase